jgi:hypothetical protein
VANTVGVLFSCLLIILSFDAILWYVPSLKVTGEVTDSEHHPLRYNTCQFIRMLKKKDLRAMISTSTDLIEYFPFVK